MKKLILMLLVLVCGVGQMKADPIDIYLCSNLDGGSWNKNATDLADFKFHFDGVNDNSENTYSLTISSSQIVNDANNVWFRIWPSGWGDAISPYSSSGSYTFALENGQNETYDVNLGGSFYNQDISFGIEHSAIQAKNYKISLYHNTKTNHMYIRVDIVDMPAKIGAKGYTTFTSNRALDLSDISGATAYFVEQTPANNTVKLTKTENLVQAGTGLVLYGEPDADVTIPVVETASANQLYGNMLVGCTSDVVINNETDDVSFIYVLVNTEDGVQFQNVQNWLAADDTRTITIPAGKAYLNASGNLARSLSIEFDNESGSTEIANVEKSSVDTENVYNINGQRVVNMTKGLYIVNGKKVIIK